MRLLQIVFISTLVISEIVFAQSKFEAPGISRVRPSLPAHYPKDIPYKGTVSRISPDDQVIVIYDQLYVIDPGAQVHMPFNINAGLASLQKGNKIAYERELRGRTPVVTEIWVLPEGY